MKTVIITGADGNLGTAVTTAFLDSGYSVIATVVNETAKNNIPQQPHLDVRVVNLTNEGETGLFTKTIIDQYEKIDAALLLVGGFAMGTMEETDGNALKKMYTLNFETAYYTARPLLVHMKEKGYGRLVFVGARPAINPADAKSMIAYSLSKSLLFNLADYINEDVKGTNITATVIVPSTLDTILNRNSMPEKDPADWVKPEQVAEIIKFICSETAFPVRESVFKVYNNS